MNTSSHSDGEHVKTTSRFATADDGIIDAGDDDGDCDPRGRLAVLTDAEHMTLAVAVETAERALKHGQPYHLTLGEAAGVVGKPDYNGLKRAFRRAAGRFAGLKSKGSHANTLARDSVTPVWFNSSWEPSKPDIS